MNPGEPDELKKKEVNYFLLFFSLGQTHLMNDRGGGDSHLDIQLNMNEEE